MTVLFVFPAAAFCLGSWQVYRLQWKRGLIRQTEAALAQPAVPIESALSSESGGGAEERARDLGFVKVRADGKFDGQPDSSFLVGPRIRDGEAGFHVVTPMTLENGQRILVNRGWVPRDADSSSVAASPTSQSIVGLIRHGLQKKSSWTPENEPEKRQWFWIDTELFSRQAHTAPVLMEALASDDVDHKGPSGDSTAIRPIPKAPLAGLRNNHMEYIVTWYSLSAATLAMILMRRRAGSGVGGGRFASGLFGRKKGL